jgi:GPH family glycoside/pentoside/hexuronide:cation symporter
MTKYFGKGKEAAGWQMTMVIFGIAAIFFFFIAFISTKERVKPPPSQKTSVKQDIKDLTDNKPWLVLLFTTLLMILFVATRICVTAHYFKYYVGNQQFSLFGTHFTWGFIELTSAFNGIGQWLAIIGVICTKWIANSLGKKKAFILLFIIAIVSTALFFFLKPEQVIFMFVLQILGSFTGGPLTPLIWAMYADTADYSEWKNKRRATGLVFSASASAQKIGWTIGAVFTGALLTGAGFIANKAQTVHSNHMLISLMSMIPSIFGILSVILVFFYKLDEKTMKKIETDLIERRLASGESVEN